MPNDGEAWTTRPCKGGESMGEQFEKAAEFPGGSPGSTVDFGWIFSGYDGVIIPEMDLELA